jgi:hypothetical protein
MLPVVDVGGITPPFRWVVDVHRTRQHEDVLGVNDEPIPRGKPDLFREGSRLRVEPV